MFLHQLHLENILSFKNTNVELGHLNVLIGPNAVGKSNLIEAISLLHSLPTGVSQELLRGGGVRQWLWLGNREGSIVASVKCAIILSSWPGAGELEYRFDFSEQASGFVIVGEHLSKRAETSSDEAYFLRNFNSAE